MEKNYLPLTSIYIPPEKDARIREPDNLSKAVASRSVSMIRFGQLQPILVEQMDKEVDGRSWKLIDGQVRWVSLMALTARFTMGDQEVIEAFTRWGMQPGYIEITTRDTLDPITDLMMEFHANEDRDSFTWDEKAKYIRRIHDMLLRQYGRKEWNADKTAEFINQSPATVSHYLQLTDAQNPATQSTRVQTARTKNVALKQLKIETEREVKKARANRVEAAIPRDGGKIAESVIVEELTYIATANLAFQSSDCYQWIKRLPNNSLDWFHWDPPYGGNEGGGGAFSAHEPIQVSHDYALLLMKKMIPEIWRVLHDGSWMAIWYTPVHYNWLRLALQGHVFDEETGKCKYCEKHILKDYIWLSTNYSCRPSPHRFWVNPYPCYWRKSDRAADGHEIQRFLTKETEPFLLCGKQHEKTPILLRSDRGNVFDYRSVAKEERRHVNRRLGCAQRASQYRLSICQRQHAAGCGAAAQGSGPR